MGPRIGILGGTFDPPHVAHLALAAQARHQLGLDRVLLVVANDPWQKHHVRAISPALARLEMVRASVGDDVPGIEACSLEIDRGGESYTVDTLASLSSPDAELFLIVGSDIVSQLDTWHRWRDVAAACTLGVAARPGSPQTFVARPWRGIEIRLPALDISSTELRAMVADGRPVDFLVPHGAIGVMMRHGLYRPC